MAAQNQYIALVDVVERALDGSHSGLLLQHSYVVLKNHDTNYWHCIWLVLYSYFWKYIGLKTDIAQNTIQ